MDVHVALDLCDAIITQLRNSPCALAFGDTYQDGPPPSGQAQFFADWAGDVAYPWLVVEEVGETYEFMSPTGGGSKSYLATGQTAITIVHPNRLTARQLGILVAGYLTDGTLVWPGFPNLMLLRLNMARFVPVKETGPDMATVFKRVLVFDHQYSGVLPQGFS